MAERSRQDTPVAVLRQLVERGDEAGARALLAEHSIPTQRFLARQLACTCPQDTVGVRVLALLASSASADVRTEAYEALLRVGPDAALGAMPIIESRPETDPWAEVSRLRLLRCMASLRPTQAARAASYAACSPHRWVQDEVLHVLDACYLAADGAIFAEVTKWCASPSSDTRETALRWLSRLPHLPPDLGRLAYSLSFDKAVHVRSAAAGLLSRFALREPDVALRRLAELARDRAHWSVRLAVARGMARWLSGAPFDALALCEGFLNDPVVSIRRVAGRHLRRLGLEHPRIALGVAEAWLASRSVRRHAVVRCLETVRHAREPQVAAQAEGLLRTLLSHSA